MPKTVSFVGKMSGAFGSGSLVNLTQSGFTSLLDLPTAAPPLRQSELAIESICKDVSADVDVTTHASALISKVNAAYLRACVEVNCISEAEISAESALERLECKQATDCTNASTGGAAEWRKSTPETATEEQAGSRLKSVVGPKRRRMHEAEPAPMEASGGTIKEIIDKYLRNSRGPNLSGPEGASEEGPDRGDLRQLGDEIFRQHSQMHTVPQPKLLDLLSELEAIVARGKDTDFSETDEEESEVARRILYSLDACIASLLIMTSRGVQQQLVLAEMIAGVTGLIKKHLLLCIVKDDQGYLAGGTKDAQKSKDKPRASAGHKLLNRTPSKLTLAITSRLQRGIKLLGSLLYAFPLEEQHIMPLVRVASQTFTARKVGLLQAAATDLIAASFSQYTQHRDIILDDILGMVVPTLPTVKNHLRKGYKEDQSPTYTLSSVIMRMIQESVKCPGIKSAMQEWHASYVSAIQWADYFWKYFLGRISSGRAAKGELDVDIKAVLEHIISDFLAANSKPELPVAGLLLQRLHAALGGAAGLQHPESHVKLVCIDLLAILGTQLFCNVTAAEQLALDGTIAASSDSAATTAILEYLADHSCTDRELSASAQQFRVCRRVAVDILPKHKDEVNARLAIEEVVRWNHTDNYMSKRSLDSGEAQKLVQIEMQKTFKRLGGQNLKWLQTCIQARDSGPQIRAKSVRALNMFIQADARLMASKEVAACFETALKDDSPSVRLESINMLGAHVTDSRDLKDAYFDILASATMDQSVGVRKAALKIVWEAYMATTASVKASEACGLLLQHVADPEESIQDQVAKYFHGLWFCGDHSPGIHDEERAARMVKVAESVIANDGPVRASQILVPLEPGHPFVDGLKKALQQEQRLETRLAVGQRLAAALLEGFLAAQGAHHIARQKALPFLLALHALAVSEVQFCIPPDKPARFVECLAPYLKSSGAQSVEATENEGDESARNEAEQLICLMSILSSVLPGIQGLSSPLVDEMEFDLMNVIRCHKFRAVVAAACETLCRLHYIEKAVGVHMARLAARYLELLEDWRRMDFPSKQSPYARRCMFVLGQMLRHGADVIQAKSEAIDYQGRPLNVHAYFGAIASICLAQNADLAMREQALRSLGMLGLARPETLLSNEFQEALSSALKANADPRMQRAGLGVVLELLKAETKPADAQMKASQRPGKGRGKVALQRDTIVAQNETSDVLSNCGGLLQGNISRVLDLMTCTASIPTTNVGTEALAASIRHSALQVAETVEMNGVLPPWTFLPQLFALTIDPSRDCPNATLSFRVLRHIAAKHPEMVHRSVGNGLEQASQFHGCLRATCVTAQQSMVLMQQAVSGLSILYSEVLEVTKNGIASFMTAVRKKIEAACSFDRPAEADIPALQFFALMVAQLPVKRGAEVLMMVQPVIHLISQHGDDVLAAAKAAVQSKASQQSWRQPSKVCAALTVLLSLCSVFAQKYGLTKDRLTSYKLDAGRKRLEGNISSRHSTEVIECVALALDIKQLQEQVEYVQVLLEKFHADYGYTSEAALEHPEDPRLGTADCMDWQAASTAQRAEKRKSLARTKAVCHKGKRKSRGKKSVGDAPDDCFEDPEDEDYHV